MLSSAFFIHPVKAIWTGGTITIYANGTVKPDGAPIEIYAGMYILTDHINSTSTDYAIVILKDDTIVNGQGLYWLNGSGISGILLEGRLNIAIANMKISGFNTGICLLGSIESTIVGNTITNTTSGIYLDYSSGVPGTGNLIRNNNIANNYYGIYLTNSLNNIITGNIITDNDYGIYLEYSSNNSIDNRIFENIITSNGIGILFEGSLLNDIAGNIMSDNSYGVYFEYSSSNYIFQNIILDNNEGIHLFHSLSNPIIENNITGNQNCGIWLELSNSNTIILNNIEDDWMGIGFIESSYNYIFRNNITDNESLGIWLTGFLYPSEHNLIKENNITSNGKGIWLCKALDNRFFHNNFIDNTQHCYIESSGYANVWNDSYPSGGNYWSGYTGVDVYWGPKQDKPGSDGINDTAYTIDSDNVDHYPLIRAWPSPEITARVETATGTGIAEFTPSSGVIIGLTPIPEEILPHEGKPDLIFPHGFFIFSIDGLAYGETVEVTIVFPTDIPETSEYWKYRPPDTIPEGWYQIPMGSNDGDNIITITLTDGGLGDDDNIVNGVILDAGGPGYPKPPVGGVTTPAILQFIVSAILALAAIIIVIILSRQQRT